MLIGKASGRNGGTLTAWENAISRARGKGAKQQGSEEKGEEEEDASQKLRTISGVEV